VKILVSITYMMKRDILFVSCREEVNKKLV